MMALPHVNPSNEELTQLLVAANTIAMVGASSAALRAKTAGLMVVMNKCIGATHAALKIPD